MTLLKYVPEYQVLICTSCQYALQSNQVAAHLRGKEHRLTKDEREACMTEFEGQPIAQQPALPHPGGQPLADLLIFRDGLICHDCSQYLCRSQEWMEMHYRKSHHWKKSKKRGANDKPWRETWCQRFFPRKGTRYFAVASTNQGHGRPTTDADMLLRQIQQQLEGKRRTIEQKKQVITESNNPTEVSSWLERTQWLRHLKGQEMAKMARTVTLPTVGESILQQITDSLGRVIQESKYCHSNCPLYYTFPF